MNIVFFEVQEWEKEILQKTFPEALLIPSPLTPATTPLYKNAEIISTFIYSSINKEVIDSLPNLKYIATRSTGMDHIDVDYCTSKSITVKNVPEYGSATVAEFAFALLLSLTRRIYESVNQSKRFNFEHAQLKGVDLFNKTIGIVGMGKIGQHVARIAQGFGMKILVYNRSQHEDLAQKYGFTYVPLEELLRNSDVITLHLCLVPETEHIINSKNIMLCKKGSYIINTARGGLIETEALVKALEANILAGVGLDVLEEEKNLTEEVEILTKTFQQSVDMKTLLYDHLLVNHPKVLITPHNAFNTQEALIRILETTIANIQEYSNTK